MPHTSLPPPAVTPPGCTAPHLEPDVVDVAVRKVVAAGGQADVDLAGQVGQRCVAGAAAGDGRVERCSGGGNGRGGGSGGGRGHRAGGRGSVV